MKIIYKNCNTFNVTASSIQLSAYLKKLIEIIEMHNLLISVGTRDSINDLVTPLLGTT
jgi:hypothetical protein